MKRLFFLLPLLILSAGLILAGLEVLRPPPFDRLKLIHPDAGLSLYAGMKKSALERQLGRPDRLLPSYVAGAEEIAVYPEMRFYYTKGRLVGLSLNPEGFLLTDGELNPIPLLNPSLRQVEQTFAYYYLADGTLLSPAAYQALGADGSLPNACLIRWSALIPDILHLYYTYTTPQGTVRINPVILYS